jgi:hypothetical protein
MKKTKKSVAELPSGLIFTDHPTSLLGLHKAGRSFFVSVF